MKRLVVALILFGGLAQQPAIPQALPAANFIINRAIAGVMSRVAAARGFAANDPRIVATNAAISSNLTALNAASAGVGVGLTMLGAPVWLTVLAGLGVVAGGAALVAHFDDSKVTINDNGDGGVSVKVKKPKRPTNTYPGLQNSGFDDFWGVAAANAGFHVYRAGSACFPDRPCSRFPAGNVRGAEYRDTDVVVALSNESELQRFINFMWGRRPRRDFKFVKFRPIYDVEGVVREVMVDYTYDDIVRERRPCPTTNAPQKTCLSESVNTENRTTSAAYLLDRTGAGSGLLFKADWLFPDKKKTESLDRIYTQTNGYALNARIDNETLARVVDTTWRSAASAPEYEGLPYSLTSPVTAQEVEPWARANPSVVPRIEDFFRPAVQPGEQIVPIAPTIQPKIKPDPVTDPQTRPNPETDPAIDPRANENVNVVNTPNVNVVNRPTVEVANPVKVDLGTAPQVATPTLDEPPTATMILDPILKMLPGFTDWKTPKYAAECPRPTFELFSKRIRMDAMCDLAEKYRPMITSIMLAVFVLIAATIVLAA